MQQILTCIRSISVMFMSIFTSAYTWRCAPADVHCLAFELRQHSAQHKVLCTITRHAALEAKVKLLLT